MCLLILIEYSVYRYIIDFLEKNLSLYSSIDIWFVTNMVTQAHIEFKDLKCFGQVLSLV